MTDPRIYLAIDNCFASKRWTRPAEWTRLIKSLGLSYIEASADNECDPLYSTSGYMEGWINEVRENCEINEVVIANLYSGHGTYSTLGLGHNDVRIKDKMLEDWLKPMALTAAKVQAGIGFFCHAFSYATMQSPELYKNAENELLERLASFAVFCKKAGVKTAGIEQMYSPHQIPWTIQGAEDLLRKVYNMSGCPFYITIDTGHQTGQQKFLRPDSVRIKEFAGSCISQGKIKSLWLGSESATELLNRMILKRENIDENFINVLNLKMDQVPYMFADVRDGDTFKWLESLGCYSPIIHLQQTNGNSSAHWPFDNEHNEHGIIKAEKVFSAIASSYSRNIDKCMPPGCDEIFLTLEIFSGTADLYDEILQKVISSVEYWRQYIPRDGMRLSEIMNGFTTART